MTKQDRDGTGRQSPTEGRVEMRRGGWGETGREREVNRSERMHRTQLKLGGGRGWGGGRMEPSFQSDRHGTWEVDGAPG